MTDLGIKQIPHSRGWVWTCTKYKCPLSSGGHPRVSLAGDVCAAYLAYIVENIRQTDLCSWKNTGRVCDSSIPIPAAAVAGVGELVALGHTSHISMGVCFTKGATLSCT